LTNLEHSYLATSVMAMQNLTVTIPTTTTGLMQHFDSEVGVVVLNGFHFAFATS
jgi:hypothetical protein